MPSWDSCGCCTMAALSGCRKRWVLLMFTSWMYREGEMRKRLQYPDWSLCFEVFMAKPWSLLWINCVQWKGTVESRKDLRSPQCLQVGREKYRIRRQERHHQQGKIIPRLTNLNKIHFYMCKLVYCNNSRVNNPLPIHKVCCLKDKRKHFAESEKFEE